MPLVKLDMFEGRSDAEIESLLNAVQDCVVDAFGVPPRDRYQIVNEHKKGRMVFEDTGLGFERSAALINIQVFTSPRATAAKQRFMRLTADRLETEFGLAQTDLMISFVTNTDADWSFANGEAQYLTGAL
ncbi:4-oxalocrotonate tautomerase [Aquimixticola soesokkakensis]|uniref:4-oxalocrotonate tautomerase n=1 Tax=Aquimixticola soesokkakensis TaxID=1519096 RepID=A0A1Y5SR57_9RHOB|nr:tautomerase family protein [Aquimixticola soesokkakensis]SLN44695.1 4-oxalocrotonate tautomerase [Aquimixticola soesokkakensis]